MSAQINLYHPRFLRQRELLTLNHLTLATTALFAVLAAWAGWAWQDAATRTEAAASAATELAVARDQVAAATRAAALRKPSPQMSGELESTEGVLRRRLEIARLLESGTVGSTGGFADFFRGLARQAPEGLWLTGFTIGAGGNDMEIRGSMLSPAALPDYIRRLGSEKVFQGRNFAALTMNRADSPSVQRPPGQGAIAVPLTPSVTTVAAQTAASPIDFVLMPKLVETKP